MSDEQGTATAHDDASASTSATDKPVEDGRTRSAWVRDRPEHYEFHDAEYGRIPDSDPPCFEKFLIGALMRDAPLVDILDFRLDLYELTGEWDMAGFAAKTDADLEAETKRGGLFGDVARLRWLRDIAGACATTAKDAKELREYMFAVRWMPAEERLAEIVERFPDFTREDAANVCELFGLSDAWAHDRDSWVYPSREG